MNKPTDRRNTLDLRRDSDPFAMHAPARRSLGTRISGTWIGDSSVEVGRAGLGARWCLARGYSKTSRLGGIAVHAFWVTMVIGLGPLGLRFMETAVEVSTGSPMVLGDGSAGFDLIALVPAAVTVASFLTKWVWRHRCIVSVRVGDELGTSGASDGKIPVATYRAVRALTDLPADETSRRLEDEAGVALLAIAAGVDPDAQAVARASLADVTGRIEAEVARREDDEASSRRRAGRLQPEEN